LFIAGTAYIFPAIYLLFLYKKNIQKIEIVTNPKKTLFAP
jgi:hypothetical protein